MTIRKSRWFRFEPFDTLLFTDEGGDRFDVFELQAFDWGHVAKVPVVGANPSLDGKEERPVGVMVWFVDDRQMGWSVLGSAEIGSVTFGAMSGIELSALLDQAGVLRLDSHIGADNTSSHQEHSNCGHG